MRGCSYQYFVLIRGMLIRCLKQRNVMLIKLCFKRFKRLTKIIAITKIPLFPFACHSTQWTLRNMLHNSYTLSIILHRRTHVNADLHVFTIHVLLTFLPTIFVSLQLSLLKNLPTFKMYLMCSFGWKIYVFLEVDRTL